jgi:hypothetical protein
MAAFRLAKHIREEIRWLRWDVAVLEAINRALEYRKGGAGRYVEDRRYVNTIDVEEALGSEGEQVKGVRATLRRFGAIGWIESGGGRQGKQVIASPGRVASLFAG